MTWLRRPRAIALAATLLLMGSNNPLGGEATPLTTYRDIVGVSSAVILVRKDRLEFTNVDVAQFCLGVLVADTFVVTARHCIEEAGSYQNILVGGLSPRLIDVDPSTLADVVDARFAPDYTHDRESGRAENDVAILELSGPVTVNCRSLGGRRCVRGGIPAQTVSVISEQIEGGTFVDDGAHARYVGAAMAIGWGAPPPATRANTQRATALPDDVSVLQGVRVPVWRQSNCREAYSDVSISDTMVCAGFWTAGAGDTCQGYSGGPLLVDRATWFGFGRETYVFAITSWGRDCQVGVHPGVYVRLSRYAGWIETSMVEMEAAAVPTIAEPATVEQPAADQPTLITTGSR
jgi:secreted trypsin-like serine protease